MGLKVEVGVGGWVYNKQIPVRFLDIKRLLHAFPLRSMCKIDT